MTLQPDRLKVSTLWLTRLARLMAHLQPMQTAMWWLVI
ncbi:hypothetical protein Nizo2535_1003 [Lactiplantibacillus plantarum]|nr:hypothetical protein Nizo2535_1003 [Lactiplantibacillus plantarum]KZU82394.1 hypothetical protein Nizo2891_0187 [Lactiplantibacillus plantarum]